MIEKFYQKYRNNRTLFPITIKLDEEIPVDYVTLARHSPFLLGMVEDFSSSELDLMKSGVDRKVLKQIILSWYGCEPFPEESLELLHCVDWLGDEKSKKNCTDMLMKKIQYIYDRSHLISYLERACTYNIDEMVDRLTDKFKGYGGYSDEVIELLRKYKYWKAAQIKFAESYSSDKPIEKCLEKLTEPPSSESRLREALVGLFFRNENYESEKLIRKVIKAHQILSNKVKIESIHPDVLKILQDGLREKLASYDKIEKND